MAEFRLPKNSVVKKSGKTHAASADAKHKRNFKVYRFDPDSGENPRTTLHEGDHEVAPRHRW